MARLLAIETATAACSVALFEGTSVIRSAHEVVGRGHAERLVPMIGDTLAGQTVDRIVVDCGPGSFTGVRVGLAAATGLAIGWSIPVAGYSSLALIAAAAFAANPSPGLAVAIPGGHGELFIQSFARDLHPSSDLSSLRPEAAAVTVTDDLVVGGGARQLVEARGWGRAIDALPDARDVVRLPARSTALPARPIYGRPPDAKAAA